MTDAEIIQRYWQRDEGAIAASHAAYGPYCHTIAQNILGSPEDAEECVNDTWLRAWQAIPPQRPRVLRLFFAKITRNLALNRWKSRTAEKRGGGETALLLDELAECAGSGGDAEGAYLAKELGEAVDRFVRGLPRRDGDVFLRRYFWGDSVGSIAARYGLTSHHVSVLLSRTRKKLNSYLIKEGLL